MFSERLTLTEDPAKLAGELRALVPTPESVATVVGEIIADVRARGDQAVSEYTQRFDTDATDRGPLRVPSTDLQGASSRLDPSVRDGLERAIDNVRLVAQAGMGAEQTPGVGGEQTIGLRSHEVVLRSVPLARAAVYVPGGRAPYPSTVVMGVVTALVAGVPEVVVCSPPGPNGELSDLVLGACELTNASAVYRIGGAQAISALAYGTESVPAVDVIVGPGNLYVQEAKRQVSGQVRIDGFAGPSDLVVIADADVDSLLPALDLLAQAEHGPGTLVMAICRSATLLDELQARLAEAPDTGAVARLIEVDDEQRALALAQALAPEHLELIGPRAEALAGSVRSAGCLFVGANAGTAFGDYIAGSNHILPTGGAARFASALSPDTFRRHFSEVRIGDPGGLARAAAPVARAEGFELHAQSMEARIRDNDSDE